MDIADVIFNYMIPGTLAIMMLQYIMNPSLIATVVVAIALIINAAAYYYSPAMKHNPLLDIPPKEVKKCR